MSRPPGAFLAANSLFAFAVAGLAACWLLPVSVGWASAPDLGHAWAVPILMTYLWWERWHERPPLVDRAHRSATPWVIAAILFALVQLPLRLLLTPFPLWPMLLVIYTLLFVGIAAAVAWLLSGRAGVRWTLAPMILLASALPAPSMFETRIILPLREGMAALAAEISNILGHPALASGTSIQLANGWVGVDEACGGIRSLQACVMIGLFFGEWYRFSWLRRACLLGAAVLSAIAGNFARVLFLSLRAQTGTGALDSAHDLAGWSAMIGSLIITGWLACHWAGYRWPAQSAAVPRLATVPHVARAMLATTACLFVANEIATRLWYAHGENRRSTLPQWTARLPEDLPTFQTQPLGDAAREMLKPDHFVAGSWRASSDVTASAYYIEWHKGQIARSVPFLHNPTVCLPLAGCELVEELPAMPVLWRGIELPFHCYKFRRAQQDMYVAFVIWDTAQNRSLDPQRTISSAADWLSLQWEEVVNARENMPAQFLTIAIFAAEVSEFDLRQQIEPLLRSVEAN